MSTFICLGFKKYRKKIDKLAMQKYEDKITYGQNSV